MGISKWLTERDKEQEGFPVSPIKRSYRVITMSTDIDGIMLTDEEFNRNRRVSGWIAVPSERKIILHDEWVSIMTELEDVPGATALEKVQRLKKWYQELYNDGAKGP